VIGPASFAAFYRQTVLELLGAFSTKLTLRQADIDLALAIRHAGFRVAVERGTKVLAPVEIDAPSSALSDARAEERLFWRNLERASFGTIVSHSAIAAWDCLSELPRPTALLRMAGRAWANLELGSHAQHRRRLAQLKAHATTTAAQSTQSRENLRIDASHHSPARSEQTQPIRARSS
jgi:hypothetical protein